jgi:DNA-binding CsgD family transcriptional regulator
MERFDLVEMLTDIKHAEILNAYQYDNYNLFSLQRIWFKPNRITDLDKFFRERLNVEYYELLNQQNDEVLCILKQKRDTGFFKMLDQGPWAFLFPISIWEDRVQVQLLAEEQYLSRLYDGLSKFSGVDVINVSNVEGIKGLDQVGQLKIPAPNFTAKQRDIASYAALHGYFESPKRISGKAIAEYFGVTEATVNIHLKNAENLAMKHFFGESPKTL